MNKTAIKNFAINARKKLIADIVYKAGLLGVNEEKILSPLPQSTSDLQFFDVGTKEYTRISGDEIKQRNALVSAINAKAREIKYKNAFEYVVEEVAYTWFNRLIALRFMEVNDYLPSRVRVLSSENPAKAEPDFVTNPYDTDLEFTSAEQEKIMQLKDQNKLDDLFRMLFIKQCNKLHEILPGLFEQTSDYTELLLTISFTDKDGVIWHLIHDIEEKDFNVETLDENGNPTGQIEIIGWMYQYYNVEPKDKVFANLKKNIKISKENIPAATQLFTPDWIVRYMVENSLGRLWVEGHPNDALKSEWKYYLEEAEQEAEVQRQLSAIRKEYAELTPEDITCIDPCMGSGHILVYMFDVLMQIYESYGYTQRDAARLIVEKNLYGLDIDKRAYQLSYFAVMMKARQYNRRILNGEVTPNVLAIRDSSELTAELIDFISNGNKALKTDLQTIKSELKDATEYGSILDVTRVNYSSIYARMEEIESTFYGDIFGQLNQKICKDVIFSVIKQAEITAKSYYIVCTNPPYMGISNGSPKVVDYVKKTYPNNKVDLFSVFMEKAIKMLVKGGYCSLITQQTWMFIASFKNTREMLMAEKLTNMLHLGTRAFEDISGEVVQSVAYCLQKTKIHDYTASFVKLDDTDEKEKNFFDKERRYTCLINEFENLPDSIFAYWLEKAVVKSFSLYKPVGNMADGKIGLQTGDNNRFLRLWHEIDHSKLALNKVDEQQYWVPYNKAGGFRRWYGNIDYVLNWKNDGYDVINCRDDKGRQKSRPQNREYYFREGLTWSDVCTGLFSMRWMPANFIFDSCAPSLFSSKEMEQYLIGLYNSKVAQLYLDFLTPTIHYTCGSVLKMPCIKDPMFEPEVIEKCISLSKNDWDSFENSWEYKAHPLVAIADTQTNGFTSPNSVLISDCFEIWRKETEIRFCELKRLEESINSYFINVYQLQDSLDPTVRDEDVSISKADVVRDIKDLLSYAIGCMFGRYSLDSSGLQYAGGTWDGSAYKKYIPDADNCIPITDEEYFEDDIVERLCEFLTLIYGSKTLEKNLEYIAKALGNKGTTSREVIRNYFSTEFFKDHCDKYSVPGSGKRPIYWLFDSGKQNGFKALVYVHRWNADTVGNVRVEYLHKIQHIYEREIVRMQEIIDAGRDSKEVNRAAKRQAKLMKQLQETKDYDAKLAHIALSRIEIDLDDGVKANYEKVQIGKDGKKQQILAKI